MSGGNGRARPDTSPPVRRLRIILENGEEVTARTEEWVAALVQMLPPSTRQALCDRVRRQMVAYQTPGSHVLEAEGANLQMFSR